MCRSHMVPIFSEDIRTVNVLLAVSDFGLVDPFPCFDRMHVNLIASLVERERRVSSKRRLVIKTRFFLFVV